ncbi:MAG: TolC family protein [Hydrogenophilales bacterium]|nr:TolC family protein [Hydrogenophilales bacterium]
MISSLAQWLLVYFFAFATLLSPLNLAAQDVKALTLEQALLAADSPHPDLQIAQAERELALADQSATGARRDLSVSFEGRLQQAQSSLPDAKFSADNSVRLLARKNLYDFGRSSSAEGAASAVVDARDLQLIDVRDQRRLDIMARYFDVLITDMQYVSDNEYMTVWYLTFDRARERFEQKLVSKVEVAELEARFQDLRVKRNETQNRQRLTRALLADAMNQPGKLVSELADPALDGNNRALPDYEELLKLIERNPKLKANQQLLEASRQRLEAVRADKNPSLDLELEASDYANRKLSGRDELRAGVVLSWPLYQGNRVSSQLAREQAQFQKLQAETEKYRRGLMSAVLAAWSEVEQLQKTERNAAKVQADYRDLALERSRALYEMELRTTLGETMATTADAKLRQRSVEYKLALALAKLDALLGQALPAPVKK